jgi:hypothetical protein
VRHAIRLLPNSVTAFRLISGPTTLSRVVADRLLYFPVAGRDAPDKVRAHKTRNRWSQKFLEPLRENRLFFTSSKDYHYCYNCRPFGVDIRPARGPAAGVASVPSITAGCSSSNSAGSTASSPA